MNIACWLARSANSLPDKPALIAGTGAAVTYRAFALGAGARANALHRNMGCRPGDRIAVLSGNSPTYMEALYAIWWAGCVAVPINAKLHAREALFILADGGVSVCFVS